DLEVLDRESDDDVRRQLLALHGVGRWTAEYVLLRGLGRLQLFPGDDVGAQKRLAQWLGRTRPLDYGGVERADEPWHPYAEGWCISTFCSTASCGMAFWSRARRQGRQPSDDASPAALVFIGRACDATWLWSIDRTQPPHVQPHEAISCITTAGQRTRTSAACTLISH